MEKAHLVIVDGQRMDINALSGLTLGDIRNQKISAHQMEKMKIDSACAELAYLCAFQSVFGESGMNLYFYGENNKPYFKCEKYGFLSLAHASGAGACLIAPIRCGVDIEDQSRDVSRIEKKIRFENFPEEEKALDLWCAKESFVKLTGEGLSRPFSSLLLKNNFIFDENGNCLAWTKTGQIGRMIWAASGVRKMEISVTLLSFDEAIRELK